MKWSNYLTESATIAERMNMSLRAVEYWKEENRVHPKHFIKLEPVLAGLGIDLTKQQMRELNND